MMNDSQHIPQNYYFIEDPTFSTIRVILLVSFVVNSLKSNLEIYSKSSLNTILVPRTQKHASESTFWGLQLISRKTCVLQRSQVTFLYFSNILLLIKGFVIFKSLHMVTMLQDYIQIAISKGQHLLLKKVYEELQVESVCFCGVLCYKLIVALKQCIQYIYEQLTQWQIKIPVLKNKTVCSVKIIFKSEEIRNKGS